MLCDPRVRFEHIGGHMSVWCDDGPVVEESRELWSKFEDQPKAESEAVPSISMGINNYKIGV